MSSSSSSSSKASGRQVVVAQGNGRLGILQVALQVLAPAVLEAWGAAAAALAAMPAQHISQLTAASAAAQDCPVTGGALGAARPRARVPLQRGMRAMPVE